VLAGPAGTRTIPAEGFFLGPFATAMADGELLVEIRIPAPAPGTDCAYEKLKRKTGDWATAAAAVVLRLDGGTVSAVRIALTNVAPTPLRARDAEAALVGRVPDDAAIEAAAQAAMAICNPTEDLRGDRAYKTAMAGEMTRRALRRAIDRCA